MHTEEVTQSEIAQLSELVKQLHAKDEQIVHVLGMVLNCLQMIPELSKTARLHSEFLNALTTKLSNIEQDVVKELWSKSLYQVAENTKLRKELKEMRALAGHVKQIKTIRPKNDDFMQCLTARTYNCLMGEGLKTKEQVFDYLGSHSEHEVKKIPNLGRKSYRELLEEAMKHGFKDYMQAKIHP